VSAGANSVLCVDIGGTSTKAAIVDAGGELGFVASIPTQPDPRSYLSELCGLIERTIDAGGVAHTQFAGIGVAVAGFLDPGRDHLVYNSNLAWLEGFSLRAPLANRFELPIELEVDSNAAAMAEWCFGSGRGSHRFLCVTSGTGLGVGMVIDGAPLRFAYGCLGDVGHVIVQRNGPQCTCGGCGCAEIMVSAPAVARRFRERTAPEKDLSLRDVIEAARAEDQTAICLLEETGEWLGIAIASMASTFFPDHIAIAGGLSEAGDFLMKAVERAFRIHAGVFASSKTTLKRAALGSRATLIGAAWPFLPRLERATG
jgi:glucokinase